MYRFGAFQHIWRTLTVRWCSDVFPVKGLSGDDDPRLPNIIALEEELIQAMGLCECRDQATIKSDKSRKELRAVLTHATELALLAFQSPEPVELVWPENYPEPGNRRISYFPGIKMADCIPHGYTDRKFKMTMRKISMAARCPYGMNRKEPALEDEEGIAEAKRIAWESRVVEADIAEGERRRNDPERRHIDPVTGYNYGTHGMPGLDDLLELFKELPSKKTKKTKIQS